MRTRLATWSLVPAGVVVGHLAAYVLAHPDALERRHALAGHDRFSLLVVPAVLCAASLLARAVVLEHRGRRLQVSWRGLAAAQAGTFVVLEVAERLAVWGSPAGTVSEPALWLGLIAQLVVAWLLSLALRWIPALGLLRRASTNQRVHSPAHHRLLRSAPRPTCPSRTARIPRAPPIIRCA